MKTLSRAASSVLLCLLAAWTLGAQQVALETDSTGEGPAATVRNAPRLLKFSGVLTDDAGKPLKGAVQLTFSLYQDQEGGMPLWQEVQTARLDTQGHYSVLLGAGESALRDKGRGSGDAGGQVCVGLRFAQRPVGPSASTDREPCGGGSLVRANGRDGPSGPASFG